MNTRNKGFLESKKGSKALFPDLEALILSFYCINFSPASSGPTSDINLSLTSFKSVLKTLKSSILGLSGYLLIQWARY